MRRGVYRVRWSMNVGYLEAKQRLKGCFLHQSRPYKGEQLFVSSKGQHERCLQRA